MRSQVHGQQPLPEVRMDTAAEVSDVRMRDGGTDRLRPRQSDVNTRVRQPLVRATAMKPNTTRSGALACAFGTPFLDHTNGRGCLWCAGEVTAACERLTSQPEKGKA